MHSDLINTLREAMRLAKRVGYIGFATWLAWFSLMGAAQAQSWTKIADEGASFSITGTKTVRYGAGSNWIQQSVTGAAQCSTSFFGSDPILGTAKECDVPSTSLASTTTGLAASINPALQNQTTVLTATISPSSATGTVTFKDGSTVLGSSTLNSGVATLSTGFASTGAHSLTVVYSGDANNASSTSAALSETVNATSWVKIADEGASFTITGTKAVRYGSGANWIYLNPTGTVQCTTGFFGSDPSLGVAKECDVPSGSLANTTSVVTASTNPALQNQVVVLTATISPSSATGNVTFKDGSTVLGSSTLNAGVATLSTGFATTGVHSLTVVYSGDANNASSTSAALSETVNVTTWVKIADEGGSFSVTGTKSVRYGSGSSWIYRNVTGTGQCTTGFFGSDPSLGVAKECDVASGGGSGTTTVLTSSVNPALVAQNTTLTATVTPSTATGTVTFMDGTITLGTGTLASGVASFSGSFSTAAAHSLTAVYGGDASNATSTSTALSQTVNKRATTTALTSSVNPAALNQVTVLTATVSGTSLSGTVTFMDGTTTLGTGSLSSGVATLSKSFTASGGHSLTAVYGGDNNNLTSTSTALTQTINSPATTTTALTSSVNPALVAQNTTLTATVTPSTATGTVTFMDGTTTLGTGTLGSGIATLIQSFSTAATHSLTAVYAGDANNLTSTSAALSQTVTKRATTTGLASSINPAVTGQVVVLTATVAGTGSSGTVTFLDGGTTLGTASLSGGVATLSGSFNTAVVHSLTAVYAGDANNLGSTSAVVSQTINTAAALPAPLASPVPVTNYEYDAQGNPTKTTQAPGVGGFNLVTQSTYDPLSRRKDTTDAKSGVTRFGYNGRDELTQITDPRSLVTQYNRNGLGDTTSLVSPDTGTATQTYDATGNLKTRTDSRGVLATYSYDALNRLSGVAYTQSGQTTLNYTNVYDQTGTGFSNGIGRLTSTSHPMGFTQYSYDAQGDVLSDTQSVNAATGANSVAISKTVAYGYDAAGHIVSILYPSGRKLAISYTGGLPSAIALGKDANTTPVNLITQIQFSPFGAPTAWLWQMGSSTQTNTRVYDTSGRLVRYRLGGVVRDITYDDADRIIAYTHYDATAGTATTASTALNQSFGYDELGRVISVSAGNSSWSIGYDANGNRTGVSLNGTASAYTTSATSNQLVSTTNPARVLGYDAAGHTTSDSTGYTSTYNLAGRLTTLTKAGMTTTFAYDGMGRRIRKFISAGTGAGAASTVIFAYDQEGHLLGEYDQAGNALREYVWLGSTPVAIFMPDASNVANPPFVYYIHTDHLDTPRVVVDQNNAIRWRWLAEPFGTTAPETNPQSLGVFTQNLRFPGQYADVETGLSYNLNRDYDASIGRYVQSDPIGLNGGINTYAYVGGDPVSYVDPYGLRDVDVHIWRSEGSSVGHVMVTEANSTQVILSQFPSNGYPLGPNQTKSFADTMAAEGRAASEVWRINVPNDKAFDAAAARERDLKLWSWSPSNDSTQCSIAASRALKEGGVGLNTLTTGTLMPGFFANGLQATPGIGTRIR